MYFSCPFLLTTYLQIEPMLFNTTTRKCYIAAGMLVTIPSTASSAFYARELPRWVICRISVECNYINRGVHRVRGTM